MIGSTLADVAARAGVSVATVSRVLNANYPVAEPTRRRVLDAVRELDYVVNAHARALVARTSEVIGVVVNDVADPFFGMQAGAVQQEASAADLLTFICNTGGSPAEELRYLDLLLRQRVRAVVLTGGSRRGRTHLAELRALVGRAAGRGTRVVLCGRPPVRGCEAVTLRFDDRRGARELAGHLLDAGHRRIGYVTGPAGNSTSSARLAGHRARLAAAGLGVGPALVAAGDFSRDSGYRAGLALLRRLRPPTAVVAANDLMAVGVLAAARELGVQVPAELSVAGFDDLPVAADCAPALTTVRLPLVEAGRRAGRIASGREAAPAGGTFRVGARLVIRDSVGSRPAG